jgi:hypothetical protein
MCYLFGYNVSIFFGMSSFLRNKLCSYFYFPAKGLIDENSERHTSKMYTYKTKDGSLGLSTCSDGSGKSVQCSVTASLMAVKHHRMSAKNNLITEYQVQERAGIAQSV